MAVPKAQRKKSRGKFLCTALEFHPRVAQMPVEECFFRKTNSECSGLPIIGRLTAYSGMMDNPCLHSRSIPQPSPASGAPCSLCPTLSSPRLSHHPATTKISYLRVGREKLGVSFLSLNLLLKPDCPLSRFSQINCSRGGQYLHGKQLSFVPRKKAS